MFKYAELKIQFTNQKGDNMELFKSKKGIVTHPVVLFIVGVVIGLVLAYVWITYMPTVPNPFC